MIRPLALLVALSLSACGGGNCPEPASPKACAPNKVPVGRWSGDWQSHPLAHPDFQRTGNIELVVAADGTMTGQISENDNPDTGTIQGKIEPSGRFNAETVVQRGGTEKRYALKGSFVCEENGPGGAAEVIWGNGERGNLKFHLQAAAAP